MLLSPLFCLLAIGGFHSWATCYPQTVTKVYVVWIRVKGAVSRDFLPLFFHESLWAPDKQAEMVFLKNWFLRGYSNLKFEYSTKGRLTLRGVEIFRKAGP